jgi:hypothetical protein
MREVSRWLLLHAVEREQERHWREIHRLLLEAHVAHLNKLLTSQGQSQ